MRKTGYVCLLFALVLILVLAACAPRASETPTATVAELNTSSAEPATETLPPTETNAPSLTEPPATETAQPAVAAASGLSLLQSRCTACHSLDRVTRKTESLEEWRAIVANMVSRGANLTPAEQSVLTEYLAATYPDD